MLRNFFERYPRLSMSLIFGPLFLWSAHNLYNRYLDHDVWARGEEAIVSDADGRVTTHIGLLNSYEIKVTYKDEAGDAHKGSEDFDTLIFRPDRNDALSVRYLPDNPEVFATSWAAESWSPVVSPILFMLFFGGLLFAVFRQHALQQRVIQTAGEPPPPAPMPGGQP